METDRKLTRKAVYTTGEVARAMCVAPRTVSKWFDSGRLKGYRIPGSQDRRIPHEYLMQFVTGYRVYCDPALMEEET